MPLAEKVFRGGPVPLNYAEGPPSGPPLVLLHGLTLTWQNWLPLIPTLALRWRVYALDLRGHGKSGRAAGSYQLTDYIDDVSLFLQQQCTEPAVILGHSLGGLIALGLAAQLPQAVSAIVVADSPFFMETFRQQFPTGVLPAWRDLAASGKPVEEIAMAFGDIEVPIPGTDRTVRQRDLPGCDQTALRYRARALAQTDPDAIGHAIGGRAAEGVDPTILLRAAHCPVLILQADPACGGLISDEDAQRLRELMPRVAIVRLAGVSHLLHLQDAPPVLRALTFFLESL